MSNPKPKPKTTRRPKPKAQGNLLMEAFESFAVARTNYQRAIQEALEAKQALITAQESLSGLGIYVSLFPPETVTTPSRPMGAEEEDAGELEDGILIPAVGPETHRSPEAEVAEIRSSSYTVGAAPSIDPNDSSALAAAVGGTMSSIIAGLTKEGGKLVVGPQMPGQPNAAGDGFDNPHAKNQHGGPTEQRPV